MEQEEDEDEDESEVDEDDVPPEVEVPHMKEKPPVKQKVARPAENEEERREQSTVQQKPQVTLATPFDGH